MSLAYAPSLNEGKAKASSSDVAAPLDRRVRRTRAALKQALIELIEEQGFEGVSTSHLCERAGITRGTFYNHCKDKEDLLAKFETEFMAGIEAWQARLGDASVPVVALQSALKKPLPFLVDLFDYLRSEGDFLHAVLGPGGDPAFSLRLRDSICENVVQSVLHEKYRDDTSPFVGYYVTFFASAYLGLVLRWIETGMQEDSEEMTLIVQRLLFIKPGEPIRL